MLVVVRQNYCDRVVLSSAVRQFEFVDAKILGVVFNSITDNGGIHKKYYKRYYNKYDRSYEAAAKVGKMNR
jgi:Mrp family chromosome partitioning ATPase